jgi:beta propeller repeat protein
MTPESVTRGQGKPCGPGCEQVSFGFNADNVYEVAGDLLVYPGLESIPPDGYAYHIVLVDLKQRTESIVHRSPKGGVCRWADTDGSRLAYACTVLAAPGTVLATMYHYDPATRSESDLYCLSYSGMGYAPRYVALADTGVASEISIGKDAAGEIYFHRFSDKTFAKLTNEPGSVWESNAHGPLLVWTQTIKAESRTAIMLHDTRDSAPRTLEAGAAAQQWGPRIEGDKVVWVDHRNAPGDVWNVSNADIYLHDLATGKTVPVTTHPARQDNPDVSGDWVVWEDFRHNPNPTTPSGQGQIDIYARNMKTGVEVRVSDDTLRGELKLPVNKPRVDKGRVFFKSAGIFMVDLAQRGRP